MNVSNLCLAWRIEKINLFIVIIVKDEQLKGLYVFLDLTLKKLYA